MFRLTEIHRFSWPVKVEMPSATTPGSFEEQSFIGHFRLLSKDEQAALAEASAAAAQVGAEALAVEEMRQIAHVLEGWSDVIDEDGAPLAFSEEVLLAACAHQPVREAIGRAYAEAAAGKARRGN